MNFREIVAYDLNGKREIVTKSMMEAGLLNASSLCSDEHKE